MVRGNNTEVPIALLSRSRRASKLFSTRRSRTEVERRQSMPGKSTILSWACNDENLTLHRVVENLIMQALVSVVCPAQAYPSLQEPGVTARVEAR